MENYLKLASTPEISKPDPTNDTADVRAERIIKSLLLAAGEEGIEEELFIRISTATEALIKDELRAAGVKIRES